MRKNNARIKEEKQAKEAKNYTQALRELKCAYIPRKNDLSLKLNKGVILEDHS